MREREGGGAKGHALCKACRNGIWGVVAKEREIGEKEKNCHDIGNGIICRVARNSGNQVRSVYCSCRDVPIESRRSKEIDEVCVL